MKSANAGGGATDERPSLFRTGALVVNDSPEERADLAERELRFRERREHLEDVDHSVPAARALAAKATA